MAWTFTKLIDVVFPRCDEKLDTNWCVPHRIFWCSRWVYCEVNIWKDYSLHDTCCHSCHWYLSHHATCHYRALSSIYESCQAMWHTLPLVFYLCVTIMCTMYTKIFSLVWLALISLTIHNYLWYLLLLGE